MNVSEIVRCEEFPCVDVVHDCYVIPDIDIDPNRVSIVMIAEDIAAALRYVDENSREATGPA